MKTFKTFLLLIVVVLTFLSCDSLKERQQTVFPEKSELRLFKSSSQEYKTSSGWFFIAAASYKKEEKTITRYRIYCKNNLGEYCLLEVEPSKIRVCINDSITKPYAKIYHRGRKDQNDYERIKWMLNDEYYGGDSHVTIYCASKDFPENINLIDLQ